MEPTTTFKTYYRRLMLRLYRRSLNSELCRLAGIPVLFQPEAPYLFAGCILFVIFCGFCGCMEGM